MGEGRKIVAARAGMNDSEEEKSQLTIGKKQGPCSIKKASAARRKRLETRRLKCAESNGQYRELAKRARTGSPSRADAELLTSSSDPSLTSCSSSEDLEGVFCFGGNTNLKPNMNLDLRVGILVSRGEVSGERTRRSHGSVAVCGRRREMEDAVVVAPRLVVAGDSVLYDFFGVYDGHGGAMVAEACRDRLHLIVAAEVEERRVGGDGGEVDWKGVMESCFAKMDGEVVEAAGDEAVAAAKNTIGSTAVVAMVGTEKVVVANCGDSRAVLSRGGVAVPLSRDHKPDRPDEMERVEAAGGRVINWDSYRVLGVLATSRSIGDHYLKPYVISQPEVIVTGRTEEDEFLILASDGLWDVVPNEMACEVTRRCLAGQLKKRFLGSSSDAAAEAAALLAELAMGRGSNDNISVVVVELRKANGCILD